MTEDTINVPNLASSYRMQRLFPQGRAAIICPIDHGLIFPREKMRGLEAPADVLHRLSGQGATGFMMSPGLVKQTQVELGQSGHLSRVMAIDSFWPISDAMTGSGNLIATVEDAVRLGVDCVKMLMPWNVPHEQKVKLTARIGKVVSEAGKWQMPVMVEPVMIGAERTREVLQAEFELSRIAYDLGADIIKIAFPGTEATTRLVQELRVPLVIAGGPLLAGDTKEALREVQEAVAAGAQGLIVGRNVWSRGPAEGELMMSELGRIAHEHYVRLW
ncbi:MAG: deoxyribose-phosphate aldolase [Pseudomonadota bacterium]|nr:deoxyribose-phosphate aldolase [Pseudomonadota bacterium]